MPATKLRISYSLALGAVRSVVIPESDSDLRSPVKAGIGYIDMPKPSGNLVAADVLVAAREFLARKIDKLPLSDRCAVIRDNKVVAVIRADPSIDGIDGASLLLSDTLNVGDKAP
jgi:hypothetical protein